MENKNFQHYRSTLKKKAIMSLIFGIMSIVEVILVYGMVGIEVMFGIMTQSSMEAIFLIGSLFCSLIFGIIGLILGILGLKSTKRNFAIAGIILCLIGLLFPLYYFLFV